MPLQNKTVMRHFRSDISHQSSSFHENVTWGEHVKTEHCTIIPITDLLVLHSSTDICFMAIFFCYILTFAGLAPKWLTEVLES